MNKPFDLEQALADPSRIRRINQNLTGEKLVKLDDETVAIRWRENQRYVTYGKSGEHGLDVLVLATKYEVRRARPIFWAGSNAYGMLDQSSRMWGREQGWGWAYCGPEFEYKVEV